MRGRSLALRQKKAATLKPVDDRAANATVLIFQALDGYILQLVTASDAFVQLVSSVPDRFAITILEPKIRAPHS